MSSASGWMSLMNVVGACIGGSFGFLWDSFGYSGCYIFLIVETLLGILATVFCVTERQSSPSSSSAITFSSWKKVVPTIYKELLKPFKLSKNFGLVFFH